MLTDRANDFRGITDMAANRLSNDVAMHRSVPGGGPTWQGMIGQLSEGVDGFHDKRYIFAHFM